MGEILVFLRRIVYNHDPVSGNQSVRGGRRRYFFWALVVLVFALVCVNGSQKMHFWIRKINEPPVGSVQTLVGQGVTIYIERLPDPPLPNLGDFVVSFDGTRYGFTAFRYCFFRDLLSIPMEWQVVIDGFTVHTSKQPVTYAVLGGMSPTAALIQFGFDNQNYSFSTDNAHIDGMLVEHKGFDRILGVVFLPSGDQVLHVEKNGEMFLYYEKRSLLLPLVVSYNEHINYFPVLGYKNPLLQAIAFFDFDEVIIFAFETPS